MPTLEPLQKTVIETIFNTSAEANDPVTSTNIEIKLRTPILNGLLASYSISELLEGLEGEGVAPGDKITFQQFNRAYEQLN